MFSTTDTLTYINKTLEVFCMFLLYMITYFFTSVLDKKGGIFYG